MSASYVRTLAETYAQALTTPYYNTISEEQDPTDNMWLTLEFDGTYTERSADGECVMEEGMITLVFLARQGLGYIPNVATAENESMNFYRNKDPVGKLRFYNLNPIEVYDDSPWLRLEISVEYRYYP